MGWEIGWVTTGLVRPSDDQPGKKLEKRPYSQATGRTELEGWIPWDEKKNGTQLEDAC